MNSAVQKLYSLARKPVRRIIGLMSGTSLDGLDIACCEIGSHGIHTRVGLSHFLTFSYSASVKEEIRKVFAKPTVDFRHLTLLNPWIADIHARMILQALQNWNVNPADIDLIASHGQTVYHCPRILHGMTDWPDATLQIGDGDHIAARTGIITISDFRQKHIAAGGEGAPLALYGDYCIFSKPGEDRIMLNMGGIANFTYLSGNLDPKAAIVTDTGPGNTLIDAFTQQHFQQDFDKDAALARQGTVNDSLLEALRSDAYFKAPFPKTTGPELFNLKYLENAQQASNTINISHHDVLATLTRFSADTIVDAIRSINPAAKTRIFASGGGTHNPLLTGWITAALPGMTMQSTDHLGISADAKEAVLFAILANEAVCGDPIDFGKPGMPATTMGKISFP